MVLREGEQEANTSFSIKMANCVEKTLREKSPANPIVKQEKLCLADLVGMRKNKIIPGELVVKVWHVSDVISTALGQVKKVKLGDDKHTIDLTLWNEDIRIAASLTSGKVIALRNFDGLAAKAKGQPLNIRYRGFGLYGEEPFTSLRTLNEAEVPVHLKNLDIDTQTLRAMGVINGCDDSEDGRWDSEDESDDSSSVSEDESDHSSSVSEDESDDSSSVSEDESDNSSSVSEDESDDSSSVSEDESDNSSSVSEDESYQWGVTPSLPCLVDRLPNLESCVYVEAFPDSGTTMSTISEDFARKIGVRPVGTIQKLFGLSGAEVEIVGETIIFVKVENVAVKSLRVLVEKNEDDELLICYRDLITLRVLAANFPNQVKNKNAALLPHPYGNPRIPPFVTCDLFAAGDQKSWVDVTVEALPDSGCQGCSGISEDFASRCGIKVSPTTIKSAEVSGFATIFINIKDQLKGIERRVAVSNMREDMLLSWSDLISLGVLSSDFPTPTPE